MAGRQLLRTAIVTAVAILSLSAASTAALADGRRIGSMADLGSVSGVWSIQHLTHTGPNTITVRAVVEVDRTALR
jgi:hypothetical protein